ncbi:MAG: hypothetical protein LBC26_02045 [Oscillospiraceae bacterium]|jgi:hypothetical protein|nr:hypothetical protein [Oscillospiraceae bacterium]
MKRWISLMALVLCAALLLAGCGARPPAGDTGPSDPPAVDATPDPAGGEDTLDPASPIIMVGEEAITGYEYQFHYTTAVNEFLSVNSAYLDGYLDPSQPFDEQPYPDSEDLTWADFFRDSVVSNLVRYIALYQEARAQNFTLSAEDESGIAANMSNMRAYCEESGVLPEVFLAQMYGEGMTENILQMIMTRFALAVSFEDSIVRTYSFTDEEIRAYYEANKEEGADYEGNVVTVRYILLTEKEEADSVYQMFLDSDRSEDAFAALAVQYSLDDQTASNGGLCENVGPNSAPADYDEFDSWCFDAARQPGDYTRIELGEQFHLLYFCQSGEPQWKVMGRSAMEQEKLSEYRLTLEEKYPVSFLS